MATAARATTKSIASDPTDVLVAGSRAAVVSVGYRRYVESLGIDPFTAPFDELPFLDKEIVFGGDPLEWAEGGGQDDVVELLTSSGQSGRFSLGLTSRAEREDARETADAALRALGVTAATRALVVNCLAMGVAVPTSLATVATPATHLEMALELLVKYAPQYEITVLLGEPVFLKELFETALELHGPGWAPPRLTVFTGGEWVAESLRTHLAGLAGMDSRSPGVFVSMGAAEIGLHALVETPALRLARQLLKDLGARRAVFGVDYGYVPSLFTYDPARIHFEERVHGDGERTLACTTLGRRALPLTRYDLGDVGRFVAAEAIRDVLDGVGADMEVEGPVVAVWGRRGAARGVGWAIRPEAIKEILFANAAQAACVTGRFFVATGDVEPLLQVQLRAGAVATPALADHLELLLRATCGGLGRVELFAARDYPHHEPGDYSHKPRYHPRRSEANVIPERQP